VQYKNKFKEGKLPIVKAISYTDYALRKFFHSAKKTNWFANTLFVFTADHTSITENASYSNSYGYHKIPIIFYQYNQEPKICNTITQQIDILPNIMEYLNYDQSYFSFGKSTINYTTNANLGVNFVDNTYQTFNDTQLIKFDTKKVIEVYNLSKDSLLQNNVISTTKENPYLNTYTKAYLQAYFQCLKGNKMNVESYFAK
jgi:phosphoglycerol transferase MdoB-like AlkP superfamily enzyme